MLRSPLITKNLILQQQRTTLLILHQQKAFHSSSSFSEPPKKFNHLFSSESEEKEQPELPPAKIISPAELAKRRARGESINEKELELTPRRGGRNVPTGVKREALKLYRNLLKVAQQRTIEDEDAVTLQRKKFFPKKQKKEKNTEQVQEGRGENVWDVVKDFKLSDEQKYIRTQFEDQRKIPRTNIEKIQYHLHYGNVKLEEMRKNKKFKSGFKVLTFG